MDYSSANTQGNNSKGTLASGPINKYGRDSLNNYFNKAAYGEEQDSEVHNIHTIRSIPILKECIYWNPDDNFDRVSALGMLMIFREDRLRYLNTDKQQKKVSRFHDDKYFKQWTKPNTAQGGFVWDKPPGW